MVVRYENTIDDLLAFNRHLCAHSPTFKRMKRTCAFVAPLLIAAAASVMPLPENVTRNTMLLVAIISAVLVSVLSHVLFPKLMDRNVRRLYDEGRNEGIYGQHELEIDADWLIERTDVNESKHSWGGIEDICDTEDHIFIYVSSVGAHVVPKASVTGTSPDDFLKQAKTFWARSNPDARSKING